MAADTPMEQLPDGKIVMPGDKVVGIALLPTSCPVQVGVGLIKVQEDIVATKAGVVRTFRLPEGLRIWVDSNSKRYIPCLDDMVIGVVTEKHSDEYKLDIRSSSCGLLPTLAFEGASKRSRPRLEVGAVVFCRCRFPYLHIKTDLIMQNGVHSALRDMEPELSCISRINPKGWMTGAAVLGELSGGHVLETSMAYARSLMHPDSPVVNCLGQHLAFETAAAANGRVWVKAETVAKTVLAVNAITNAQYLPPAQAEALIARLAQHVLA